METPKPVAPDTLVRVPAGSTRRRLYRPGRARMTVLPIALLVVLLGLMTLIASSPDTVMAQSGGTSDPLTLYDANDNGVIDTDEAITAVSDYLAGRIDRDLVLRVLDMYFSANSGASGASATPGTPSSDTTCGRYDVNSDGKIDGVEVLQATADYFDGDLNGSDVLAVVRCFFNPTEFHEESYSFSIAEDAGRNSSVGTVSASSTASYSIITGNVSGRFSIASTTGAISVATGPDFEVSSRYELTVKAHGSTESTMYDLATVNVNVTDVNEAPVCALTVSS